MICETRVVTRRIARLAAILIVLMVLGALAGAQAKSPAAKPPKTPPRPKLVVLLVVDPNAAGFCVPLRCHSNGGRPPGRSGRDIPASSARESGQHGARPRFLLSMGNKSIR